MTIPDLSDREAYELKVALKLLRYGVMSGEMDTYQPENVDLIQNSNIKERVKAINSLLEKLFHGRLSS
jgi:hypothetical protein